MQGTFWLRLTVGACMICLLAACGATPSGSTGGQEPPVVSPTEGEEPPVVESPTEGQEPPVVETPTEAAAEPPATSPPADSGSSGLEGATWRLDAYGPADAPVAALPDVSVTITFESGNQVGGSGGCNSYGATYELDGQSLTIGQINSTMMACENEAVNQQESAFLGALGSATAMQVNGDQLTIDYDGGQLKFTRIA